MTVCAAINLRLFTFSQRAQPQMSQTFNNKNIFPLISSVTGQTPPGPCVHRVRPWVRSSLSSRHASSVTWPRWKLSPTHWWGHHNSSAIPVYAWVNLLQFLIGFPRSQEGVAGRVVRVLTGWRSGCLLSSVWYTAMVHHQDLLFLMRCRWFCVPAASASAQWKPLGRRLSVCVHSYHGHFFFWRLLWSFCTETVDGVVGCWYLQVVEKTLKANPKKGLHQCGYLQDPFRGRTWILSHVTKTSWESQCRFKFHWFSGCPWTWNQSNKVTHVLCSRIDQRIQLSGGQNTLKKKIL